MSRKGKARILIRYALLGLACISMGALPVFGGVVVANESAGANRFPLVARGVAALIVVPTNAPEVVRIAARDLATDIAAVAGSKPNVVTVVPEVGRARIELILAPAELSGRWEAFQISCRSNQLAIVGSDPRGLAFGIYEISRRIGVSPWYWWADVPIAKRAEIFLTPGIEAVEQPAVKYRGIFINDEDWGLQPWAAKTFEPEVGSIGPKTYARIFELLLRLRANCLWPGMHPTTKPFHQVPGNAAMADAYAIVLGSSHAEPMLRNNVGEWQQDGKLYNYLTNRDGVLAYWEQRVRERTNGESLFTLGMRGMHDSPIVGPKNQKERIATLEKIFADQRALLADYLGQGAAPVAQVFCPYKEVLDDYNAGLRVPGDVTLVWPDDNFGYIRRFATPAERARSGGLGIYYHLSYLGAPLSWLWVDTMPPALIWSEMMRAYEQGARTLWIANVGDIKNTERSLEFFLDLAWNADRTDEQAPLRFQRVVAGRDFGATNAEAVADILSRMQAINFARRAEHLQWHLPKTPYQPTELNESEIHARLAACASLQRDSDALAARLSPEARDAYFQLVGYPVGITAAANRRYFSAELARADMVRGRPAGANQVAAQEAWERLTQLTARYNNDTTGGKWRNIVTEGGVARKEWERFQPDPGVARPEPTSNNICPPMLLKLDHPMPPPGARAGDFVEVLGVISIHAGHFTARTDLPSGAGWRVVPGLGRTGSAVTVLPSNADITTNTAPSLEYRFHVATGGDASLRVRLLPTFPIVSGRGLRLAFSIDSGDLIPVVVANGFDTKNSQDKMTDWQRRVLSNATEASVKLPVPLKPGLHSLRLVAVDPGVVVDKIVIGFGEVARSYDGPDETRLR